MDPAGGRAQDIKVSDEEVQKQFADQKKQSFPKEKDYQKFLKTSGMTEDDLLFRVKLDVLSNKVRQKVIKGKDKVTDAEIDELLQQEQEALRPARAPRPARRPDARPRPRPTRPRRRSRRARVQGRREEVLDRRGLEGAGRQAPGVAKGQQEKAFDDAIFGAKKGESTGPVKTQFGYYVFQVTKVTPASQQTLAQTKETIKNLLKSQNQQKALNDFVKKFRKELQGRDEVRRRLRRSRTATTRRSRRRTPARASGGSPQVAPPQGARRRASTVPRPQGAAAAAAAPQGTPVPVPQG